MKYLYKKSILIMCLVILLTITFCPNFVFADEVSSISINSPSAILIDSYTNKVLYEKNSNERRYPASITKVMTAIIVLEKCSLDEVATVSPEAVLEIGPGYVSANLQVGENFTIEQLLNVLMVASSNDAAIVLAEHISGSVEEFSVLMNEKAKELGCLDTNFINPNGVHSQNHYSTAYDLALIGSYAMKNETFRNIVAKTSYSLPATSEYPVEDRYFTTTNSLIIVNNNQRADNYYYKYATGIKTGFTTPAGNCLIASSKKDNFELITVVLGAPETKNGLSGRFVDTISLFDYGYDTYNIKEILKQGTIVQTYNVKGASKDTKRLDIVVEDTVSVLTKKSTSSENFLPEVKINENLKAPIKKNDVIGTITYVVEDITYTENLIANSDVKPSKWFFTIIEIIFIILIILTILKIRLINKKKKRLKLKNKMRH